MNPVPVLPTSGAWRVGRITRAPFWLLMGALAFALIESVEIRLGQAGGVRRRELAWIFVRLLPPWTIVALLGLGIAWLSRRFALVRPLRDGARGSRQALAVHAVAAALFPVASLALLAAFDALRAGTWATPGAWHAVTQTTRALLAGYYVLDLLIYVALAAACHAAAFLHEARMRARRELELERQGAEARLAALRQQLRPHFLFNALNTVSMLVRAERRDAAVDALARLGGLLRASLKDVATHEVALADELSLVRDYLALEQARFGARLQVAMNVADDVASARVPAWLLQPLVENAVVHGVARVDRTAHVAITARRDDGALTLEVRDDGPGPFDARIPAGDGHGVGLANLRARLAALYGGAATFELAAATGGGTSARVLLPAPGAEMLR